MQKEFKKTENRHIELIKPQFGFHIEIDKGVFGTLVTIHGVRCVTDISRVEILMKIDKGRIKIVGEELEISVYENRILEISGRVTKVELL